MIPVTKDDVRDAQDGVELTHDEAAKLPSRAQKASDLVEGYLGQVFLSPSVIPAVVTRVTAGAVARLYQRDRQKNAPAMFTDQKTSGMGPFNATIKYSPDVTSGDPWLTKADKTRLKNVYSGHRDGGLRSDRGWCPPQ